MTLRPIAPPPPQQTHAPRIPPWPSGLLPEQAPTNATGSKKSFAICTDIIVEHKLIPSKEASQEVGGRGAALPRVTTATAAGASGAGFCWPPSSAAESCLAGNWVVDTVFGGKGSHGGGSGATPKPTARGAALASDVEWAQQLAPRYPSGTPHGASLQSIWTVLSAPSSGSEVPARATQAPVSISSEISTAAPASGRSILSEVSTVAPASGVQDLRSLSHECRRLCFVAHLP